MRRLGHGLRVEARSLNEHVADKDDILDGIENLVRGDIEIPRQGPPGRRPPTIGDLGPARSCWLTPGRRCCHVGQQHRPRNDALPVVNVILAGLARTLSRVEESWKLGGTTPFLQTSTCERRTADVLIRYATYRTPTQTGPT
jgi:hypothetical protein